MLISIVLILTPFLFYIYKYAPADAKEWNTVFGSIRAYEFPNVQALLHAVFTKTTFVILTTIWFLTSKNWWKYAILIPLTMFMFQLIGVANYELKYIDEFDFWYSLPIIAPILLLLMFISYRIGKRKESDLKTEVDEELKKLLSDDL